MNAMLNPGQRCVHVCVDMQRLFAEPGDWHTPALDDILPAVLRLARHFAARTLYTRFVTPFEAEQANGRWCDFYRRWPGVLVPAVGSAKLNLVEPLRALATPAQVVDKTTYSAFNDGPFAPCLARLEADTLVFSGVETDVCVLGTVLDAVDRGFRVVVATDAVASSNRASHQATLDLLLPRFDSQVELLDTQAIIDACPGTA